jgi:DNA-binding transcriptional MerR regulator
MGQITIGAVAARTGLRASAIRYYEAEGLLPPPPREHGRRVYDTSVFSRLAVIKLGQTAGFNLSEIRFLLSTSASHPAVTWKKLTKTKREEIERQMRALALKKRVVEGIAKCHCRSLDDCGRAFSAAVAKYMASPPRAHEQRAALRAYLGAQRRGLRASRRRARR